MRSSRTLKSRIAAINKRIGELPTLVTFLIKKPDGSQTASQMEPIDALITLIDACFMEYGEQYEGKAPEPAESHPGYISELEISKGFDPEDENSKPLMLALGQFERLKQQREGDPVVKGSAPRALC